MECCHQLRQLKILGERLPNIIEQWKKDKELFGDLPFDIDPSVYAATGNQLNVDDAASSNKTQPNATKTKVRIKRSLIKRNKGINKMFKIF